MIVKCLANRHWPYAKTLAIINLIKMKTIILMLFMIYPIFMSAQEIQLLETVNYRKAVLEGTRSRDGRPGPRYWQNHADYNISVRLDTAANRIYGEVNYLSPFLISSQFLPWSLLYPTSQLMLAGAHLQDERFLSWFLYGFPGRRRR